MSNHPPIPNDFVFSPDLRRFAYWTYDGSPANFKLVGVDLPLPLHPSIGIVSQTMVFSPDSVRFAYAVRARSGGQAFVLDGKMGPMFEAIGNGLASFSPDSQRFAYCAQEAGKRFLVVDGKERQKVDGILGQPLFSPDSHRVAFIARRGASKVVIVEDEELGEYDAVSDEFAFTADSRSFIYFAARGDRYAAYKDGDELYSCGYAKEAKLSPDRQHAAWIAYVDGTGFVFLDGDKIGALDTFFPKTLVFSPDSKRLAYCARIGSDTTLFVDGKQYGAYDSVIIPARFSPDSKHWAYLGHRGRKQFVVRDGVSHRDFDGIERGPLFSQDSRRLAYVGRKGRRWSAIVDEESRGQSRGIDQITFTPDSRHLLFWSFRRDGVGHIAVDGDAYPGVSFRACIQDGEICCHAQRRFYTPGVLNSDLVLICGELPRVEQCE